MNNIIFNYIVLICTIVQFNALSPTFKIYENAILFMANNVMQL